MRSAIAMLIIATLSLAAHADETVGHAKLNQARAGAQAMEAYYEALRAGATQIAEEKREQADTLFAEVTEWGMTLDPEGFDSAATAAQYAEAMDIAGQFDLAARAYNRAYALDSQEDHAIAAARNYRRISPAWFDDAVALLTPLAADTTNAEIHAELAHIYHEYALYDLAAQSWTRALELDPESRRAKLGKALIDVAQARVSEANTALSELGQLNVDNSRFLEAHISQALAHMERRQLTFPATAENHAAFAQLLVRVGHNFDALLAIQHATMLEPTNYSWFNLQGGLAAQQGRNDKAIAAYQRSLAINADQPRTRELLAQLEEATN